MDKEYHKQKVLEFHRTKKGLISKIYNAQVSNRKKRGKEPPSYNLKELREWVLSKDIFHVLYKVWKESNYKKGLIPSLDRINSLKGYSFDNLQIITWDENNFKGRKEKRSYVNKIQYTNIKTNEVGLSPNYREASKVTGDSIGTISLCINNNRTSRKFSYKIIN